MCAIVGLGDRRPRPPRSARVEEEIERAWADLLATWDDDRAHERVVALADAADRLPLVAQRYRSVADAGGERAARAGLGRPRDAGEPRSLDERARNEDAVRGGRRLVVAVSRSARRDAARLQLAGLAAALGASRGGAFSSCLRRQRARRLVRRRLSRARSWGFCGMGLPYTLPCAPGKRDLRGDQRPSYSQRASQVSKTVTRASEGSAGRRRCHSQRARISLVGFERPGTSLR